MTVYQITSFRGSWKLLSGNLVELDGAGRMVIYPAKETVYGVPFAISTLISEWTPTPEEAVARVRNQILARHKHELEELESVIPRKDEPTA